jgi:hypothetical protein
MGPVWHDSALRVCPETLCRITKLSKHGANGCETQEGQRLAVQVFPILCQPSTAVEPGDGSFDDPPTWKHYKTFVVIRAFDNFNFDECWGSLNRSPTLYILVSSLATPLQRVNHRAEFVAFCRHCSSVYGRDRCIVQLLTAVGTGRKRANNPPTSKSVSFCAPRGRQIGILGEQFFWASNFSSISPGHSSNCRRIDRTRYHRSTGRRPDR